MRMLSAFGAGVSGLSLLLAVGSSGASSAPTRRVLAVPPQRGYQPMLRAPAASQLRPRRYAAATPVPCPSDTTPSFVGIPAGNLDYAAGNSSGVASGFGSQTCSADDGILSGENNFVGPSGSGGDADWSSIAGGASNNITAEYGFIGAGTGGSVSGRYGFVGSGYMNSASGADAFVGSGDSNVASGADAFVGGGLLAMNSGINSAVGGGQGNSISGQDSFAGAGLYGSIVSNGGFIGSGDYEYITKCGCTSAGNVVSATDAFVGSGDMNVIGNQANGSFIGGGGYAWASDSDPWPSSEITGEDSFIGAGDRNYLFGALGFLGSGEYNTIDATANYGVLGGGYQNTVDAGDAFIGGGANNVINTNATYGTIAGGYHNAVASGETYASVLGGSGNTAKGEYATVAGGYANSAAGVGSFAAGYQAQATHNGSFVWSDYNAKSSPLQDAKSGQFVVRASGGVTLFSNEALTSGVSLTSGSGTWANLSDRNAKTDIVPLDDASILAKVATLPVDRWSYKSEKGVRHVGPMAQDFYAAFGTGADDRHITSIDEDGVALAAIKALHRDVGRLNEKNARLQTELEALEAKIDGLEAPDAHHVSTTVRRLTCGAANSR